MFWSLTLRQISTHLKAAHRRNVRQQNDRAWLAWTTARLMQYHHQPHKMPKLRSLLAHEGGKRPRQSSEQQLQIVMAMHAAFSAVGRNKRTSDGR